MSTRGKDFWMGFMNNHNNSMPTTLSLYISSTQNTSGTVSIPGMSWTQNFNVIANTTFQVVIPTSAAVMSSGVVENKGIHITSADSVTVFALSYQEATSDASIIYPTQSLDREYRILTIQGWPYTEGAEYLIVATEDNSTIEITPFGGAAYTINLNSGQAYQLISTAELSGATVKDLGTCNKIAVFSGSLCDNIGGCGYCDHLYEQLLPISRWGKNFITVPLMNKAKDYFRIIANYANTSITIDGGSPIILNQGGVHQYSTGVPSFIQSSQPVFVMQYAQGIDCDGVGDPFSVIVPPMEQSINDITFNAFTSSVINSYYVNIVTRTANTGSLTLDAAAVTFTAVPSNPLYSYARIAISSGNHRISSAFGFTASVYGFGQAESYGYSAGFSMNNLQYDFTMNPNWVCLGVPINFSTQSYTNINSYQWIFGDGTTGSGLNATHSYTYGSNYRVGLVLTEIGGCRVDTMWKALHIGQISDANFRFSNTCANSPVQLINTSSTDGGPFSGQSQWDFGDGQSDTINNNPSHTYTNPGTYSITLFATSDNECSDSLTQNIIIYPKPQVSITPTDSTLCGIDSLILNVAGADFYNLVPFNYVLDSIGNNFLVAPREDIQYMLIGSNIYGCKDTAYSWVYFKSKPIVDIGSDLVLCPPETALLNPGNSNISYSITWCDSSNNTTLIADMPGIYWVRVSNQGCITTDTVELIPCANLWVPNCFTPDNSYQNDYFYAVCSEPSLVVDFEMYVYNRWGALVFESNNVEDKWDGTFNGKSCDEGVYNWIINYSTKGANNEKMYFKRWGTVTLLR